jgi:hypothetical protein
VGAQRCVGRNSEFIEAFDAEAERLGLIPDRLGGLAMVGDGHEALLERMRALKPGARWADVLGHPLHRLSRREARLMAEAKANPERYWRQRRANRQLSREIHRVMRHEIDAALARGHSWGLEHGRRPVAALKALRGLPDGAGSQAFLEALRGIPDDE